jgi:hypothetical protein
MNTDSLRKGLINGSSWMMVLLSGCAIQDPLSGQALRDQSLPKLAIPTQFSASRVSGPILDQAWLK